MYKCHHNHDNNKPKPSQETSPAASFWQRFLFPSNSLHRSTDNIKRHALVLVTHNTVKMQLKNWITGSTPLFIPSNYIPPPFLSPHMMPAVYPEQIRQYNLIRKKSKTAILKCIKVCTLYGYRCHHLAKFFPFRAFSTVPRNTTNYHPKFSTRGR